MPDENAKIILAATHGKLTKVRDTLAIEDTINALKCEFRFRTSDWDGTAKTAIFARGKATPSTSDENIIPMLLDENNECDVPHEVLADQGVFSVGVFGSSDDYRIVSDWMYYKIKDGCFANGGASFEPSQTIYEQITTALSNKSDINHNHNDMYITISIADAIINESVARKIEEIFGSGTFDAGPIIERS